MSGARPRRTRNIVADLSFCAWLDEDGEHVWTQHECVDGVETTMLPHPQWRVSGDKVYPSVICDACGLHAFSPLVEKPEVTP